MTLPVIDFLSNRKSAPIDEMTEPGPSREELDTILRVATRVPDHGRLAPWRFIIYQGDVRRAIGDRLAALAQSREGELPEARLEKERTRFSRAPLVIGVISSPKDNPKIPEWEMFLSGGMAAMNLMLAANALGYATNLITNWYSDDPEGRRLLGLEPNERVVGFVHIGTHDRQVIERPRPELDALVTEYSLPKGE